MKVEATALTRGERTQERANAAISGRSHCGRSDGQLKAYEKAVKNRNPNGKRVTKKVTVAMRNLAGRDSNVGKRLTTMPHVGLVERPGCRASRP
jgi:hypothetical protein